MSCSTRSSSSLSESDDNEGYQKEDLESDAPARSHADPTPIPDCEGVDRNGWSGKALLARDADSSEFAEVIIITSNPNACVDSRGRLGKDNVDIVVLEVYKGDPNVRDTCLRWPMRQLFYLGATWYVSVYNHACKREVLHREEEARQKRVGKKQYQYDIRARATASEDKKTSMLLRNAIADVFMQTYCDKQCTLKFNPATIASLRTEMHLHSFQVKAAKNLDIHRSVHGGGVCGRKLVTLEGIDISLQAWRIIHNILVRTFDKYKAKANVRGAPHGNLNMKKPRVARVQAIETLRLLLEASANHMPHLLRTLDTGENKASKSYP